MQHSFFSLFPQRQQRQIHRDGTTLTASITHISNDPLGALNDIEETMDGFSQESFGHFDILIINGNGCTLDIPADRPLVIPGKVEEIFRNMTIKIHSANFIRHAEPDTSSFTCDCTILCDDPAIIAELILAAHWVHGTPTISARGDAVIISATPEAP